MYRQLKQRGMTLLEVMIAMVIFSIGMLGLAALQVAGISETGNSEKRTQATLIANDMIERIRANPTGDYSNGTINYSSITALTCSTPPNPYCEDAGTNSSGTCTAQQMAVFDASLVACQTIGRLPSAGLRVDCTDANGTNAACTSPYRTVRVNWVANSKINPNKNLNITFRP